MTGNPWYRILAPRQNASRRLIIFPHAGGGPAYYRDWSNQLPDSIEVAVVQLPGRASRCKEAPFRRMESLLESIAPNLTELFDRPAILFGHSVGALVAFEIARLWKSEGRQVVGLIVAGAAGPQHPRTQSSLSSLSDLALRLELARLGGTPAELNGNDELFELFLPTLRADLEILETYTYRVGSRLSIPVMVCGGSTDGWTTIDQLLDWSEVTISECDVRLYVGGHFFVNSQRDRFMGDVRQFMSQFRLEPADVDLWRLRLDVQNNPSILSTSELERADRFLKPEIRNRYITARSALRRILGTYLHFNPKEIAIKTTDFGKPILDPTVHRCPIHFNVSHSGDIGLVAMSARHELGVDVEQIRPQIATAELARRYFSASEVKNLESSSEMDRPCRFFDFWSAKEAYIKARGQGLHIPLDEFDVPLNVDSGPLTVIDRHTPAESGRWHVYPFKVTNGFAAAVCVDQVISNIGLNRLRQ